MTSIREQRGLDVAALRDHFPSLTRTLDGSRVAYLDGPGGTQVPRECIAAMADYLERSNANHGGAFTASVETDALLHEVHAAAADFVGAHDPDEIAFGPNMTTLTFAVSRAIGRDLAPGDEIVVTRLDHDANVAPWLALAEECRGLAGAYFGNDVGLCRAARADAAGYRLAGPDRGGAGGQHEQE